MSESKIQVIRHWNLYKTLINSKNACLQSSNKLGISGGHQHVIHPFPQTSKLIPGTHVLLLADKDTKIHLIFQCKHSSIPIKKLGSWCIQNFPTFGHQTICRHLAKWYKMYYTALFNYLTIFPGLKSATKTCESAESTIVFTLVSWAAETANSAAQRFTFQNGWKNPWCFTAGNMDVTEWHSLPFHQWWSPSISPFRRSMRFWTGNLPKQKAPRVQKLVACLATRNTCKLMSLYVIVLIVITLSMTSFSQFWRQVVSSSSSPPGHAKRHDTDDQSEPEHSFVVDFRFRKFAVFQRFLRKGHIHGVEK